MKTTVELPDDLFLAAKKRALELRIPLKTLFERGLRRELTQEKRVAKPPKVKKLKWVTVPGPLAADLDVSSREKMLEWLEKQDR